jgi:hypothetical protein
VTLQGRDGRWRGHFTFRPHNGGGDDEEIRTAEIFLEDSESEIDRKARGLGRPLLGGLLSSAIHTARMRREESRRLRRLFHSLLTKNALELVEDDEATREDGESSSDPRMRSLYESYRLDQVAHLISLVEPEAFDEVVNRILAGRLVDFGAKDRIQFAMIVVEHLESLLPLPPFEVWAEDYRENEAEYALYSHTLHRADHLP